MRVKKILFVALLFFFALTSGLQFPALTPLSKTLVLDHVTIINTKGTPVSNDMRIVIEGDRITHISKSDKGNLPLGATVIDANGKYLIPGLWDSHTHAFMFKSLAEIMIGQFIASGVIGIRDMHGELEVAKQVKKDIQAGKYPGPHIYYSGSLIDGPKPVSPTFPSAKTVDDARRMARERTEKGVDFVKVYSRLARDQFFAIADEVKKLGVPFAGHVPFTVTAAEASRAGLHAFEHLLSVETGVSTKEDELRQIQMEAAIFQWPDAETVKQSYSKQKAEELFTCFVKNDTWQVPTLVVIKAMMNKSDSVSKDEPRFKFLPAFMKEFWSFEYPGFDSDAFENNMKALYPFYEMLVRDMQNAGVGILAGSDTPNPFVFPGFSLHEELELLVQAGLTPMEALQSATVNPARFLGYLDSHGTIEKGKKADLVLLNANPLDNIGNTKEIEAVILGGKLLGQAELKLLWKRAEDAAARDKTTLKDLLKPNKDK